MKIKRDHHFIRIHKFFKECLVNNSLGKCIIWHRVRFLFLFFPQDSSNLYFHSLPIKLNTDYLIMISRHSLILLKSQRVPGK